MTKKTANKTAGKERKTPLKMPVAKKDLPQQTPPEKVILTFAKKIDPKTNKAMLTISREAFPKGAHDMDNALSNTVNGALGFIDFVTNAEHQDKVQEVLGIIETALKLRPAGVPDGK